MYSFVRLEQETWGDGQIERWSDLEIDDQIELQGAFHILEPILTCRQPFTLAEVGQKTPRRDCPGV